MNNVKCLLALVLALCMVFSFSACGGAQDETEATTEATTAATTEATTETTEEVTEAEGVTYQVTVLDESGAPIAGAMVQICLDVCIPNVTDEAGVAQWTVEEADYKVSFLSLPAGYTYSTDAQEFYFDGETELTITLNAEA